jgi:ParB-like chromosome segregation protein Spo0J
MERHGQKDRIDVLAKGNGYELVEGHGRVMTARLLGWKMIAAKVYPMKDESDRAKIREAILEATAAQMKMSGAQFTEYLYREQEAGQIDVRGLSKAVDLINFMRENLDPNEVKVLVLEKNVGPDALQSARRAVREMEGLPARGQLPQELNSEVAKAFRWVVKHQMTRAVIDWFNDQKGHAAVRKAINADVSLPKQRRGDAYRDAA